MNRAVFRFKVILLASFLLVAVVGCKQEPELKPPTPYPPPIPGPVHGCSFDYPEGWISSVPEMELDPARPAHYNIIRMVMLFEGPFVGEYQYRVNLSVVREELAKNTTLEEYIRTLESEAKEQYLDYNNVSEYPTFIAEIPAVVRVFTATSNSVPIKKAQAVFIEDVDNVGYVILYDVPEEFYDEYAECFELLISTFEFDWR